MKLNPPRPSRVRTASAGTPAARATSPAVKTSGVWTCDIDGKRQEAKALPRTGEQIGRNYAENAGDCRSKRSSCPLASDSFSERVALALGEQTHRPEAGRLQRSKDASSTLVRFVGPLLPEDTRESRRGSSLDGHDTATAAEHTMPLARRPETYLRVK